MNQLLMRLPLFHRLFGEQDDSRSAARNRLKSALVGDRQTVAPKFMPCLQKDMEEAMSRYLRADKEAASYKITDRNGKMTLSVEVPILCVLRQNVLPEDALKEECVEESIELKLNGRKLRKRRKKRRARSVEGL